MSSLVGLRSLLVLTALGWLGVQSPSDRVEPASADDVSAAGEMFAKSCVDCHQVPDKRFAVDRAWLKQIADTA